MLIRNKVRQQKLLVCLVIIVCFSESLHLHVCLLSGPRWDKRLFEAAQTDGGTGRLSDRHRGLRLQCGRRHVASKPLRLHNASISHKTRQPDGSEGTNSPRPHLHTNIFGFGSVVKKKADSSRAGRRTERRRQKPHGVDKNISPQNRREGSSAAETAVSLSQTKHDFVSVSCLFNNKTQK